jgi:integrase/recombinase XerC
MKAIPPINQKVTHLRPVEKTSNWDEILNDWLSTKRSPHTQRQYKLDIKRFLSPKDVLNI